MASRYWIALICVALLGGCGVARKAIEAPRAWFGGGSGDPNAIDAVELMTHIRALSSDEFAGRLPGGVGEELTVAYLEKAFREVGATPGNPDGSFVQEVPLMGLTPNADVGITVGQQPIAVEQGRDITAVSPRYDQMVRVRDSEIVFAGYGVYAPEYNWDDFKGVDLRGKTLLMLVNDPPLPDPQRPGELDPKQFNGKAMTYYGRWTYKFDIASQLGAAAVFVIHETGPAGYPWEVVGGHIGAEHFSIYEPSTNNRLVAVQGWMHHGFADRIMRAAGHDYESLKQRALARDFRPVALGAKASMQVQNRLRRVRSRNVVARIPGSDPAVADELIIYTAHWDHLGTDRSLAGDQIFNGASDNATGTAALVELAQVFARKPPRRSVLFLATTAEEQGLLGARYYARNPLYPLTQTLAAFNMDNMQGLPPTTDVVIVGKGQSELENYLARAAQANGRTVRPDPTPETGMYYRSDHFELAKVGVPALYLRPGIDQIGKPAGWGREMHARYYAEDYHKVSDEIKPFWDLRGMAEDLELLHQVGREVADGDRYPRWLPGSEFRAVRERSMAAQ